MEENQMMKNMKICIECGKSFPCPPSSKKVTCSTECRKIHARKRQTGKKRTEETKKNISASSKGRDMSKLHDIALEATKRSPKTGRFESNVNAMYWHLISPEGKHYMFKSLNFWLRKHCREFFNCEPDSKEYKSACSGLAGAKRAAIGRTGKSQKLCDTYKGWRVLPTDSDREKMIKKMRNSIL